MYLDTLTNWEGYFQGDGTTFQLGKIHGVLMKRVPTVRKGIEEKEIPSNFKVLMKVSSEAIIIHRDMKIMEANPAAAELLGINDPKELVGRSVLDFIHPENEKFAKRRRKKLLDNGELDSIEQMNIRADGKIIYTEARSVIIEYLGEPAVMTIASDISNKHCMEEELIESRELYRGLMEEAGTGIGIWSEDGKLIRLNEIASERMGGRSEEFEGKTFQDLFGMANGKVYLDRLKKAIKSKKPLRFEDNMEFSEGERFFTSYLNAIKDKDGKVMAVQIISNDITDRKKMEMDIKESEGRFRRLAENAKDIIYRLKIPDGYFEYISPSIKDIVGYSQDEVYKDVSLMRHAIHPDFYKWFLDVWIGLLHGEVLDSFEYKIISKDGNEKWLNQRNTIVKDKEGNPIALEGIVTDVTENIEANLSIKQNEEKFRTLYENMVQGVFYQSKDGRLIDCNKRTLEIFGLTEDQIMGRTSMDPRWKVLDKYGNELSGEKHPSVLALSTGEPQLGIELGVFNPIKDDIVWININAIPQFRNGEKSPYQVFVTIEDISDKKNVLNALTENEEKYRTLFENILNGFALHKIIRDDDGTPVDYRFIEVNHAFELMTGLKSEMIVGKLVSEVIPGIKADPVAWIKRYGKVAIQGIEERFEDYSSDLEKWYSVLCYSPKKEYFATLIEDITPRKLMELEMQNSQNFLENLIRTANTIILTLGPDGSILTFNAYAEKITGYRREEVIGKNWMNLFIPEEERSAINEVFHDVLIGKHLHINQENPILTKKGELKYISWANTIQRDKEGNVETILTIGTDVTDKRRSQRELLRSQILLFETLNNLTDSVSVINQDMVLEFVNSSFRVLLKKAGIKEDPLGKNLMTLQPYLPDKVRDEYQRVFKKKEVIQTQEEIRIDDIEFVTQTIKIPLIIYGRIEKVITVMRDITKEKESERNILEERKRSEFYLDLLGHDIGNLHQGIYTGFQLARRASDPKVKEMGLDSTEELIKRSVKLVKNVLLLSRLGAKEPELERLDLRKIIRSSIEHVRLMFPGKDVDLKEDLGKGKLEIMAEPIVEELFLNLMHNGIKFQEGKVPKMEIGIKKNKNEVTVIVSDHGFGIKDPEKERLFGRFTPRGRGSKTGIGLSLVKVLTDRYGGEIDVRNRVDGDYGKGTKFLIKFPLA